MCSAPKQESGGWHLAGVKRVTAAGALALASELMNPAMIAVVVMRDGEAPNGALEAIAECDGAVLCVEWTAGAGALAIAIADRVRSSRVVVFPASPDGRDLAPRVAHALGRPLLAGAVRISPDGADVARHGGRVIERHAVGGGFVATLQPGVRDAAVVALDPVVLATVAGHDSLTVEVRAADPSTVDLIEAPRIIGGGAGLDSRERFEELERVAARLGCSVGATRVVTDRGWLPHERQIGTTGVVVSPSVYVALGISGAVQHTGGLGQPDRVIAVNTDPYCPMMQMADLAIVADANEVLAALTRRLAEAGARV
jgi:electron transfer flavoprotein alpha subunit